MGVGMNEGHERTHRVDQMVTEGNSEEGKMEIWRGEGWGWERAVNGVSKIMVLDWGRFEMVVNSCLEHREGRMRFKGMWKLIP